MRRDQVQRLNEAGIRTVAGSRRRSTRPGESVSAQSRSSGCAIRLRCRRSTAALARIATTCCPLTSAPASACSRRHRRATSSSTWKAIPYFAPERGLEYLFGVTTIDERAPRFRAFQASGPRQEKAAFEQFIDFVRARLEQWPDLHVYHYAAYEPSALKRLMAEHATREDELDDLLRREVFVDLYQVVRQSMRISHPSYSIKKVRTFFMEGAGQGAVPKVATRSSSSSDGGGPETQPSCRRSPTTTRRTASRR